jgi:FkbM family methyltransferase
MTVKKFVKYILPYGVVRLYQKNRGGDIFPRDAITKWFNDKGDETLRLDYNELNEKSIVFDCGGYKGSWTSDIFSKYCSNVYVFEIVKEYADLIKKRFSQNEKIKIYSFGLGRTDEALSISVAENSSSVTRTIGNQSKLVEIKCFSKFIDINNISNIDLIKINIEGSEYDLLEHIIESKKINMIDNLQIQFHSFFPDAKNRRKQIQIKLEETHLQTWNYEFVWENWKRK